MWTKLKFWIWEEHVLGAESGKLLGLIKAKKSKVNTTPQKKMLQNIRNYSQQYQWLNPAPLSLSCQEQEALIQDQD